MMVSASKVAIAFGLGIGLLLLPAISPAGKGRKPGPVFRSTQGQEVVSGSYHCDGSVFSDEQEAQVSAGAWLTATSGITDRYSGISRSSAEAPEDLDAMAAICDAHFEQVLADVPTICTLGPVERERGEFGNGASVYARFDFVCQGTRDEVIGVIGGFGRLALTARLP